VIDFVGARGDMVVIMGEEILRPNKDAPYAGKNHTSSIHGRVEAVRWRLEAVDSSGDDNEGRVMRSSYEPLLQQDNNRHRRELDAIADARARADRLARPHVLPRSASRLRI